MCLKCCNKIKYRIRQHRYLELTIFYLATVIAKDETTFRAGTPFALQTLKLQWRSGD
jgi:hypothetical protein